MTTFLILAPYAAFSLLTLAISAATSAFVAAATCLAVMAADLARGRSTKILPAGSAILFAGIGLYLTLVDPALNATAVKLAVDSGVFALALGSIVAGRPFSLQYALELVPAETARLPGFVRVNYMITGVWAIATLLMMAGNIAPIYLPSLPIWSGLAVAIAARYSALFFTRWYPAYCRSRYSMASANA